MTADLSGAEGTGINCGADCSETYNEGAVVTLMATPVSIRGTIYRKYGPTTPGDPASAAWYSFSHVTVNSDTSVTLYLRDGQFRDDTGADGIIVDQGGPAQPANGTAAIPTMTACGMIALLAPLGIAGLFYLKKKSFENFMKWNG